MFLMKKVVAIWDNDFLIENREEINNVAYIDSEVYTVIDGIPLSDVEQLNEKLATKEDHDLDDLDDVYELEDFLKEEYPNVSLVEHDGTVELDRYIAYDHEDNHFEEISVENGWETVKIYSWWDGSNWREEVLGLYDSETLVTIDDDREVSLDEWDGSNWKTKHLGYHQSIYKITEIDNEIVKESLYLLKKWSQMQDDHPTAQIMTKKELEDHLHDLELDVVEYMDQLGE